MMTIDELFDARDDGEPVMIPVQYARLIVRTEHGLHDMTEFNQFLSSNDWAKNAVCAATLYEWLGY